MTDLTPPPMSEEHLALLMTRHTLFMQRSSIDMERRILASMCEAVAARDEQWRQRLELRAYELPTYDVVVAADTPVPAGTPLYRIKEQG